MSETKHTNRRVESYRTGKLDGLKPAFERLTDGVSTLVKQHIELARHEVKQDVNTTSKRVAAIAICGVVALVGYLLLNATLIMLFGLIGGVSAAFITGVVLTVLHLAAAGILVAYFGKKLRDEKPVDLAQTNDELDRDKQWLRKIGDNPQNGRQKRQLSREERRELPS